MSLMNLKPFCHERHNRLFIGYCEVIILPCGKIEYVYPSHIQALEQFMRKKTDLTPTQLYNKYIESNSLDTWIDYLIQESKCVAVWYHHYKGHPNKAQQYSLDMLIAHNNVDFKELK